MHAPKGRVVHGARHAELTLGSGWRTGDQETGTPLARARLGLVVSLFRSGKPRHVRVTRRNPCPRDETDRRFPAPWCRGDLAFPHLPCQLHHRIPPNSNRGHPNFHGYHLLPPSPGSFWRAVGFTCPPARPAENSHRDGSSAINHPPSSSIARQASLMLPRLMWFPAQPSSRTDMARATFLGVASLVIDDMSIRTFYFQTHSSHLRVEHGCLLFLSKPFISFLCFPFCFFLTLRPSFQDRKAEPPMMNRTEQNARAYWDYQGTYQDCHVMSSSSAFWEDVLLSDSSLRGATTGNTPHKPRLLARRREGFGNVLKGFGLFSPFPCIR